jgi:hypothetical protein
MSRVVALLLLVLSAPGCLTWKYVPKTDVMGPVRATPPPTAVTDASPVDVWIGSAPGGIVKNGDTISVAPEAQDELALVGRTRIQLETDPPFMVAAMLGLGAFVLCAPVGVPYWFYLVFFSWTAPDATRDDAAKKAIVEALQIEARRYGADMVVYAELLPPNTGAPFLAEGFLVARRGAPRAPPADAPKTAALGLRVTTTPY